MSLWDDTPERAPALSDRPLALAFPLHGSRLIEASAGTGKTFTISALYVRLVLGHGGAAAFSRELMPPEILVMTFTDAATQELRDRIRTRLTQAALFFREEIAAPDDLIGQMRADFPEEQWPQNASKLEIAAQWMDEAAVSTIHGWCQRMLREHAFDSGSLFTQTLETDHSDLISEVVRDYWRQHCYSLDGAALAWVANAWGTPDALQKKLIGLLKHPGSQARQDITLSSLLQGILQEQRTQLQALKAPWQTWADELREIFDGACRNKQVNARRFQPRWYNRWCDLLSTWAHAPEMAELPLDTGFVRMTPEGMAEIWTAGEPPSHPGLDAMRELQSRLENLPQPDALLLEHAATWVGQRFDAEKRRRAEMGFDDMLNRLDAALSGPNGARLAEVIRTQFPVALIDEFQDTDPVQYRIFDMIYDVASNRDDSALLMIGDPKQAIYAFRGADIYTYLQARQATSPRHYSLDTNFRSTSEMVDAVNQLFLLAENRLQGQGAFLFRRPDGNPVPFSPVKAKGRPQQFMVSGTTPAPLTCWLAPSPEPLGAGAYRQQMAAGAATEIVRLLGLGLDGQAGFMHPDGDLSTLRPADIAILVRDFSEARAIRSALAERGVRSVYLSDKDSVFDGQEAHDVLLWLKACAEPDNDRPLRAALASRTLGLPLAELDRINQDERSWENRVLQFRAYRELWRRQGVLPMLRRLLHDFELPRALVARSDGERVLTNLLHLAELMQQAASELDGEQALIRHLAQHLDPDGKAAEDQVLRLESDEQLLKVVTIHKSKGLEYPLVFLPFICSFKSVSKDKPPVRYHDAAGRLVVRLHPDDEEVARADRERLAEDLRLLYVAVTRARFACWMGWADLKQGNAKASVLHHSAPGYLLGAGEPLSGSGQLQQCLEDLARASSNVRVEPLPEANDQILRVPLATHQEPQARPLQRVTPEKWWIASYSALQIHDHLAVDDNDAPHEHGDRSPETPQAQKVFDDDTFVGTDDPAATASGGGLHQFPRGPNPGTFLHGLLEWAGEEGFARVAADPAAIQDAVARRCNRRGWNRWIEPLSGWLGHLLNDALPLGATDAPVRLAGLRAYRVEMEFWFQSTQVDVERLDAQVRAQTLGGAPRAAAKPERLNGMFKGFVDLTFEHEGRYYVADYKSNWLGEADTAYHLEAMRGEILDKRYDLQYVLYLLALHRQLKARLADYDYDRHMGGALYLFVRGSRAPSRGLFFDRPPRALIERLDRMFTGVVVEEGA